MQTDTTLDTGALRRLASQELDALRNRLDRFAPLLDGIAHDLVAADHPVRRAAEIVRQFVVSMEKSLASPEDVLFDARASQGGDAFLGFFEQSLLIADEQIETLRQLSRQCASEAAQKHGPQPMRIPLFALGGPQQSMTAHCGKEAHAGLLANALLQPAALLAEMDCVIAAVRSSVMAATEQARSPMTQARLARTAAIAEAMLPVPDQDAQVQ